LKDEIAIGQVRPQTIKAPTGHGFFTVENHLPITANPQEKVCISFKRNFNFRNLLISSYNYTFSSALLKDKISFALARRFDGLAKR
jgi:hypothetical protein